MLYAFSVCRLYRAVRPYLPDQVLLAARTAGQLGTDAASFPFTCRHCLHSITTSIHCYSKNSDLRLHLGSV